MRRHRATIVVLLILIWFGALVAQEGGFESTERSPVYTNVQTIRFPHQKHTDVSCSTCHSTAVSSRSASDDLAPEKSTCEGCHSGQSPTMDECSSCHQNYPIKAKPGQNYRDVRPAPMSRPNLKPSIRFDHKTHVGLLSKTASKSDDVCATCHAMGGATMPKEAVCTSCHTTQNAPTECTTCHVTDDKTKRLKTTVGKTTLKPNNHTLDWMKRHGEISQSMPDDCATCHTESQCATCHVEQRAMPFAVHPPNFLQVHSLSARSEMGTCNDCHNAQTFCFQCHTEANAVTESRHDPPARLQFHPPGWLDASTASNHGINARRNIVECASCHRERDCVTCHTGINPHPADFVFSCRKWLEANAKPCTKCHTDLEDLAGMCR